MSPLTHEENNIMYVATIVDSSMHSSFQCCLIGFMTRQWVMNIYSISLKWQKNQNKRQTDCTCLKCCEKTKSTPLLNKLLFVAGDKYVCFEGRSMVKIEGLNCIDFIFFFFLNQLHSVLYEHKKACCVFRDVCQVSSHSEEYNLIFHLCVT